MGILPCCELGNFSCSGPHMFPVVLPLNRLIAHTNQVHHGDGEARISQSGAFFTQAGPHCVCPGNSCECAPVASGRYSPKRSSKQRANMRCSSGSRARKIITSSTRSGTSVMATGRSRRLRRMRASCEMFFCTRLIHYSMHEHTEVVDDELHSPLAVLAGEVCFEPGRTPCFATRIRGPSQCRTLRPSLKTLVTCEKKYISGCVLARVDHASSTRVGCEKEATMISFIQHFLTCSKIAFLFSMVWLRS